MAEDDGATGDSSGRAIKQGDSLLVLGKAERVFPDGTIEVTFEPWWPRWSAILVKACHTMRLPKIS
jgi:hypothetical protein